MRTLWSAVARLYFNNQISSGLASTLQTCVPDQPARLTWICAKRRIVNILLNPGLGATRPYKRNGIRTQAQPG